MATPHYYIERAVDTFQIVLLDAGIPIPQHAIYDLFHLGLLDLEKLLGGFPFGDTRPSYSIGTTREEIRNALKN